MKKYIKPECRSTYFDIEDIITQSSANGVIVNSSSLVGDSATMYDVYSRNSTVQNTNVSVFTW